MAQKRKTELVTKIGYGWAIFTAAVQEWWSVSIPDLPD
jgi:hypothetical protein